MSRQSAIVLGLSALSLAGLILYYAIVKKKKKVQTVTPQTDEPSAEFMVANDAVPFIVGKNEEILKSIEQATGTRITFKDHGKTQLCQIRGSDTAAVERAQIMVKEKANNPPKLKETMQVPSTAANRIIGLCGEALEELMKITKAKVWIERGNGDNSMDTVVMEGTRAEINAVRIKVDEKVKEDQEILKKQKEKEIQEQEKQKEQEMKEKQAKVEPVPEPVKIQPVEPTPAPPVKKPSPARITETPEPRDVHPPKVESLSSNNSHGQLEVYVSAVAHPSKFFVQMVGAQSVELDLLIDAMSEYYNDESNRQLHLIQEPTVGQMVAAKFAEDEKWYRAEIVAIQENEFGDGLVCDLFYVDYGDNQYVYPKDVYQLKKDFLGLKYQAMECFLAYVKPNNPDSPNSWPQKTNDRFDELTKVAQWKKLLLNIVTYRPGVAKGNQIPGVELYDTENGHDINIGQQLISEGLALPSTTGYFGDLVKSSVLKLQPEVTTIDLVTPDDSPNTSQEEEEKDSNNGNINTTEENTSKEDTKPTPAENNFNNNNFNITKEPKKDPQSATLDFLSGERQSQTNGNNENSTSTKNDDINSNTEQRQVKQWSDLLKDD
uniref:CSON013287 protein n=1 Tax=Culicoides sonorensis TaxID=179676 RepID=A0A336MJR3_CULSO